MPEEIVLKPKEAKYKSRIVVIENIYHQVTGEQPMCVESRYTKHLDTEEQVYQRRLVVDQKPRLLDLGWVEIPAMIHVQNEEGRNLQVVPTEEELEEIKLKDIILSYTDYWEGFIIPPGESQKFIPTGTSSLIIRSNHDKAKCTITVYPG